MALPGEIGWIGKHCPEHRTVKLISAPMSSAGGWFLGTYCPECRKDDPSPHSRETHYYSTRLELVDSAFAGRLRFRDATFRGMKMLETASDGFVGTIYLERPSAMYAIICHVHGRVFLTQSEYDRQMCNVDALWTCPTCGNRAFFDDETYEKAQIDTA
jgi:hypothetical protein